MCYSFETSFLSKIGFYLSTFFFLGGMAFADLPVVDAILTDAPEVPPPTGRTSPALVKVDLETTEVKARLADGVEYTFWTFGGKVPGKFIRVREGDSVEFTLRNHPSSKMPHNIDLHAVTGPGGGAASSFTAPGHSSKFSFQVLNPGLYVYHCATAPVGMHVANGMYGLILVEPKKGMPKVDKEFYIMQSEFYTKGKNGDKGYQPFSMEKALTEIPDYVVFNGSVGAITGNNALQAEVGDTVRLYVGNGGPNLLSSFHVIGEIFDNVYPEGGFTLNKNVQTTLIPAGGSAIAEFKTQVPGDYVIVDHSIFRAFNKGALGILQVKGDENKTIYSGKQEDKVYLPEGSKFATSAEKTIPIKPAANKKVRIRRGKNLYNEHCAACHQLNGKGIPNAFPPLAKSDYLKKGKSKVIKAVTRGLSGKLVVNGKEYNGAMPAWNLSNEEIANVLTYIYNSWGNSKLEIKPKDVKKHR